MLDKLRIAVVLLVIGALSGLAIWGTHTLTEERIEMNRERARLAVYLEMFPEMDIEDGMVVEVIEHSPIFEKISIYDTSGNLLGYALRGSGNNAFGFVNLVVGTDPSGNIIGIEVTETDNTPSYINPMFEEYIRPFVGDSLQELTFRDGNVGATASYNTIRQILEAAVLLVAGDPMQDGYQSIMADTDRYSHRYTFEDRAFTDEVTLIDSEGNHIGFAYHFDIEGATVALIVNPDNVFQGLVNVSDETVDGLEDALAAFDDYIGVALGDITLDVSGDLETAIAEKFNAIIEFFDTFTRADVEFLLHYEAVYEDDNLVGYRYIATTEGHNNIIVLAITIDLEGALAEFEIIFDAESAGYRDDFIDDMPNYIGRTDVSDVDATDTYAGATVTAGAMLEMIDAALNYHAERGVE